MYSAIRDQRGQSNLMHQITLTPLIYSDPFDPKLLETDMKVHIAYDLKH